ncbi:MAG TPA: hypothetical protein VMV35_06035 [Halothiobacillus sp.]|nr:hypothetical protein [Halothiobacillus sp.]
MIESPLILPIRNPAELGFRQHIERFVDEATHRLPSRSEANILLAAAGSRLDQQCMARYATGMVWLTWYYHPAWDWLMPAIEQCAAHVSSVTYLQIQQQAAVLRHLSTHDQPRPQPQSLEHLLREAEMIIYLKTGRWAEFISLP